ncbi:MAG: hypothetical protein ACOC3I_11350, partial [Verrucomicrobiota bacterium]
MEEQLVAVGHGKPFRGCDEAGDIVGASRKIRLRPVINPVVAGGHADEFRNATMAREVDPPIRGRDGRLPLHRGGKLGPSRAVENQEAAFDQGEQASVRQGGQFKSDGTRSGFLGAKEVDVRLGAKAAPVGLEGRACEEQTEQARQALIAGHPDPEPEERGGFTCSHTSFSAAPPASEFPRYCPRAVRTSQPSASQLAIARRGAVSQDLPFRPMPMSSPSFALILHGATGFTGQLVAEFLDQEAQRDLSWAIAGRNRAKLEALQARLKSRPAVLIADSQDGP